MLHKLLIIIIGSSICWVSLQVLKWHFFLVLFFSELHLKKITWSNPGQQWLQMNETNATKKAFALRVIETVEREGIFEFIWEIDTLKNMVFFWILPFLLLQELYVICLILTLLLINNEFIFSHFVAIISWSIRYSLLLALRFQ